MLLGVYLGCGSGGSGDGSGVARGDSGGARGESENSNCFETSSGPCPEKRETFARVLFFAQTLLPRSEVRAPN